MKIDERIEDVPVEGRKREDSDSGVDEEDISDISDVKGKGNL